MSHISRRLLAMLFSTAVVVAISGAFVAASATSSQQNDGPPGNSHSITDDEISIQLWNFAAYVGFGTDATAQARAEEVLRRLSEMGYRNVEPFTFNGRTAAQFKALLDKYHLKAPSRHGDVSITNFAQTLADSKTLRQKNVGSGGFPTPGIGSYENTLATAIVMNELGRRSVRNGTGKFYGHNHQQEFRTQYADPVTGQMKSAWQILVENTDPRYVAFQLDVLWATDGGADPVELLRKYPKRIQLLHIKDGVNVADPANATPVPLGEGEMEFEPILRAAKGKVRYYVYEQDPPFDDPTFDPFASAQAGWDYLSTVRLGH
jgi:Xylose isomerase-like TIM barrel